MLFRYPNSIHALYHSNCQELMHIQITSPTSLPISPPSELPPTLRHLEAKMCGMQTIRQKCIAQTTRTTIKGPRPVADSALTTSATQQVYVRTHAHTVAHTPHAKEFQFTSVDLLAIHLCGSSTRLCRCRCRCGCVPLSIDVVVVVAVGCSSKRRKNTQKKDKQQQKKKHVLTY